MATANVTAARLHELLHYDPETGVFTWRKNRQGGVKAGQVAGCLALNGYAVVRVDGRLYTAHRLAWFYVHGAWPANKVDHRNRQRTDNRLSNLREASDTLNGQNVTLRAGTAGTHLMVGRNLRKPWGAAILAAGKKHYLGYFGTQEEAHAAYLAAKRRLHEGCTI